MVNNIKYKTGFQGLDGDGCREARKPGPGRLMPNVSNAPRHPGGLGI